MERMNPGIVRNAGFQLGLEQLPSSGAAISGKAVTDVLYVSANGSGRGGGSWTRAFQHIQDALDAASTDGNNCTLIMIAPHETNYDIYTTGDPTWTGNYILQGAARNWAKIKNTHAGADSISKFTGKVILQNLNINLGAAAANGIIFTHGGSRCSQLQFVSEDVIGAVFHVKLIGDTNLKHSNLDDVFMLGHRSHTTGIYIDKASHNVLERFHIYNCLEGIYIDNAISDDNYFQFFDIGYCETGIIINDGDNQHFHDIDLHNNTTNIDDSVGNHQFLRITDSFPINILPDNFVGVQLTCGAAGVWGADTEIIPAVSMTKPFRVVGIHTSPSANELFRIRLSDDSGSNFFDDVMAENTAWTREGMAAPVGTERIFNKGIRISGSAKSVSGGNTVKVWLEIQSI